MFFDIVLMTGVIFCVFTSLLIWFRFNKGHSLSGNLLAAMLFLIGFCNSFYLLIIYGVINHFPYLYKVPAPFTFLIFPLSYLYVRTVLKGKNTLRKTDALHLIPFLFFTVNYLPFFLMDISDKTDLVYRITQNYELSYTGQDGLFPEWLNIFCRSFFSVIYLLFQWRLIRSFFKKHTGQTSKQFITVKKWVYHFTAIQAVYSGSLLLLYGFNGLVALDLFPPAAIVMYLLWFLVNSSFLVVACYLLWNPHLLAGLPKLSYKNKALESVFCLQRIQILIQGNDAFLNPMLTVYSLSQTIGISARKITKSISHSQFENFNDYINQMRIAHAVEKINEGYLNKHSVDALSEISGFNSKNAFYRAFKKAHGCTPLKYKNAS